MTFCRLKFAYLSALNNFCSDVLGNKICTYSIPQQVILSLPQVSNEKPYNNMQFSVINGFCGGLNVYLENSNFLSCLNKNAHDVFLMSMLPPFVCNYTQLNFYLTEEQKPTLVFLKSKGAKVADTFVNIRTGGTIKHVTLNIQKNIPKEFLFPEEEKVSFIELSKDEKFHFARKWLETIYPSLTGRGPEVLSYFYTRVKYPPFMVTYNNNNKEKPDNEMSEL